MPNLKQFTKEEIKAKRKEAFKKLTLPFMLFSIASIVLATFMPIVVGVGATQPTILQLSLIGIAVIIPSALFIWWASRLLKLSTVWMILVVFFLSIVGIVKFVLVPNSLYGQTYSIDRNAIIKADFDPNTPTSYLVVSLVVFLIYALVFWIYYRVYRAKVIKLKSPAKLQEKRAKVITGVAVTLIAIVLLALVGGAFYALIWVPFMLFGGTIQYLQIVFKNGGLTLILALVLATLLAFRSIQVSATDSIAMKRPTIIVICAWIALSVLLMYQIVWIIYMTVLVTLAPFKVVYFSSK